MIRLCFLISCFLLAFSTAQAEIVVHRGVSFYVYHLDQTKEKLELHLSGKKGEPNTFVKLATKVKSQGRELKFAMNAGIFEGNFLPSGLHISEGETITNLNLKDFVKDRESQFTPNFFLKPNGVFFLLRDGTAGIAESARYASLGLNPVLANQSGPLLLYNNKIHPILTEDSTSERYRNGVGITTEGKIVFVCSVQDPKIGMSNLYRFAELFREKLNCPKALYLDGDLSYIYIKGETPPIRETNWFAGILAITEPAP